MKKGARVLGLLMGCGIVAALIATGGTTPVSATGTAPVTVTFTPLPVQGSVTYASTPDVNIANTPLAVSGSVSISGTPTVSLSGTPTISLSTNSSVSVSNALDSSSNAVPLLTRASDNPAFQPYQSACQIGLGLTCAFDSVPSGKRLVIQEFDFDGDIGSGNIVHVFVHTTLNSKTVLHAFTLAFMGTHSSLNAYATHQQTALYSEAGSTPVCDVDIGGSNAQNMNCQVSGYLVDVQ